MVRQLGGPEMLQAGETAMPQPRPGKVLVRVLAARVGPWDATLRHGRWTGSPHNRTRPCQARLAGALRVGVRGHSVTHWQITRYASSSSRPSGTCRAATAWMISSARQ
jgi:NADPH:quinone reductase-like Zn-dependent oxidoreductase